MSFIASSIAALLLSGQAAPPSAPAQQATQAEAQAAVDKLFDLMRLIGTCSDRFPPEVGQAMTQSFTGPDANEVSQAFRTAYDEGKASSEARTITLEQCMARLETLNAEMNAMKARLEAAPATPGS